MFDDPRWGDDLRDRDDREHDRDYGDGGPDLGRGPSSRSEKSETNTRDRDDERWPERDRDPRDLDPRDAFMRDLDLPRGREREIVHDPREREYTLRGSETVINEELESPLHPATISELKWYFEHRDKPTREQIDLHWHDLRHEGACRLHADGVDIRIIQLMLGHASVQQTQRYLNVTDEELRRGLEISWTRRTLKMVAGGHNA
jgi:hypothetical protein